jgi:probable phosphomutase (TIGR03848 family)
MTTFLLIRHALCDPVGHSIAGRQPGVHLNAEGRRDAVSLGAALAQLALAGVYSSPLERALETAEAIAAPQGLPVSIAAGFNEVDFGEWTGKTLEELDELAEWRRFNTRRSETRIPGGEVMPEVLSRAASELDRLSGLHPGQALLAVVSHGDVIRAVLAAALGMSLDHLHRLEVSPASVSVLCVDRGDPRVLQVNLTAGWSDSLVGNSAWRAMQDAGVVDGSG